jgi:hypothetical protein
MRRCIVWYTDSGILGEPVSSSFKIEDHSVIMEVEATGSSAVSMLVYQTA